MCFSASASFAASGVLVATGVANIRTKPQRSLRWFAAIPFLFSIQQAIEGAQWLVPKGTTVSILLAYAFLLFAFVIWPVYLPFAITAAEPNPKRKKLLRWFLFLGIAIAMYLLGVLVFSPLQIIVDHHHIDYAVTIPFEIIAGVLYVIAVSVGAMCSTRSLIRVFGFTTWFGAIAGAVFTYETFISVWCFVYALLSMLVFLELRSRQGRNI